jgi:hypothetical protein
VSNNQVSLVSAFVGRQGLLVGPKKGQKAPTSSIQGNVVNRNVAHSLELPNTMVTGAEYRGDSCPSPSPVPGVCPLGSSDDYNALNTPNTMTAALSGAWAWLVRGWEGARSCGGLCPLCAVRGRGGASRLPASTLPRASLTRPFAPPPPTFTHSSSAARRVAVLDARALLTAQVGAHRLACVEPHLL